LSQPHGFGHVFMMTPVLAFALGIYPVVTTYADYVFLFLAFMAATELLLLALAGDLPYESVWRSRQMWVGLTPVYIWAAILALAYGPKRKPVYRVTRKTHQVGLYWQEVLPQIRLFLALTGSILSPTLALTVAGPSPASATPSPPRRSPRWPSRPLLGTGGMSSGRAHRPAVRPRTEHRARRPLLVPLAGTRRDTGPPSGASLPSSGKRGRRTSSSSGARCGLLSGRRRGRLCGDNSSQSWHRSHCRMGPLAVLLRTI